MPRKRKTTARVMSKGNIYLWSQVIKSPISGEIRETRVYAFEHVVYRMAFGKESAPDVKKSTVREWSSTRDLVSMRDKYSAEGYQIRFA